MKKIVLYVILSVTTLSLQAQTMDEIVDAALEFSEQQIQGMVDGICSNHCNSRYPRFIEPGTSWKWISNPPNKWTSGFFPGCLWNMYKHTKDPKWEAYAKSWTEGLSEVQYLTSIYVDQGFTMMPSYGHGYELTGEESYKSVIIQSAESYAGRWNAEVEIFEAWDKSKFLSDTTVISGAVDQLVNIDLFYEAAALSGSTVLSDLATTYAVKLMENIIRNDFSVHQSIRVDANTGDVVHLGTIQGLDSSTTWSRGQAWAVYGFTISYRYTKDKRFLDAAIGTANYFIDNLPEDHVPYWDFNAPNIPNEPKDASSSAIVSSALIELITFIDDGPVRTKLRDGAYDMIRSLASDKYKADPKLTNAILLHSVSHKPANKRVDVPLIYAEHYFVEALVRYKHGVENELIIPEPEPEPVITSIEDQLVQPNEFVLRQNYPNPFNQSTIISYHLAKMGKVELTIYNNIGEKVRTLVDEMQQSGKYEISFDADNLPNGIYFYQLHADANIETNKMILRR